MAEAHPVALRVRVVEAYRAGEGSLTEVATRFGVGPASAKRWVWLFNDNGSVEPSPKAGGRRSSIDEASITAILDDLGDPTAGEITAAYNRARAKRDRVHVSSIKRALHRFGYVVKKSADGRWRVCVLTSSFVARCT